MQKRKKLILRFIKLSFEISIIFFFIGSYLKIFNNLDANTTMKVAFSLIYIWFTIGMTVNLILPLLKLIENKINKN